MTDLMSPRMGVSTEPVADTRMFRPIRDVLAASEGLAVALLLLGVGLLLRIAFILVHFDIDWEPDGYNHVNIARSVFLDPPGTLWLMIDVWAKPLYTAFFGVLLHVVPTSWPAIVVTQITNALFWTGAAWLTLLVARDLFPRRGTLILVGAIAAFTYVSFRASVTANTEAMGALIFAGGLWLWQRGHFGASLVAMGSLILVRTDAGFCVVVFPLWAMGRSLVSGAGGVPRRMARAVRYGVLFSLPLVLWNLLGYLHTGSPLYVLTHGYPMARGIYGFGHELHYVKEFVRFDTVLFGLFGAGTLLALVHARRMPGVLVVSALASAVYFAVMTLMWAFGAFGSAGLLRYFVFNYPAWLLLAGLAADRGLAWIERRPALAPRAMFLVAGLALVTAAQLHWLVREPVWHHGLLTRVPDNRIRTLRSVDLPWDGVPVYTDRPDVLYYLGRDTVYADGHPLRAVRTPERSGIFVFTQGWSEGYSGVTASDFAAMEKKAVIPGPYGEVFHVYVR